MQRILIAEDEKTVKDELVLLLKANGYLPVDAPPCDLALLDIGLPGKNGYELCQDLRKTSDAPVIFLTAKEGFEAELLGFGVGADDFVRKPYNTSVLLARIARLLKNKPAVCQKKGLTLNLADFKVTYQEKCTELTRNETRILACLMTKELVTRDEMIEDLWVNKIYIDENTLYVSVSRLREKLKQLGVDGIVCVRGVGYRL